MNKPRIARLVAGALLAGAVALPAAQTGQAAAAPDDPIVLKAKITWVQPQPSTDMSAMSKRSEGPWP